MLASVSASALNVRSVPLVTGRVLGVLEEGAVVDVLGESNNWAEIPFKDSVGYVHASYLEFDGTKRRVRGVVTASLLNVRGEPSTSGTRLGAVRGGSVLVVRSVQQGWLEVEFNNGLAYVSQQYVQLFTPADGYTAEVTTGLLNVRSAPSLTASVLGQLNERTRLNIDASFGNWALFVFNGAQAYVQAKYLRKLDIEEDEGRVPVDADVDPDIPSIPQAADTVSSIVLEPGSRIPVSGDSTQIKVARAWNSYGGLLEKLSIDKDIDVACAVAVLCVESSGKGFEQNNQNRMIIRFENHKFWKYWGRHNAALFRDHFRYSSDKVWKGHEWRASTTENWQGFHGKQSKEWDVFAFARNLDADSAMLSISMGAPQIMGFHFERIGYQSVNEMFQAFSNDIGAQINGLFDFFSTSMVRKLQTRDFEGFAAQYNGAGQKKKYGDWIRSHYEVFKQLKP